VKTKRGRNKRKRRTRRKRAPFFFSTVRSRPNVPFQIALQPFVNVLALLDTKMDARHPGMLRGQTNDGDHWSVSDFSDDPSPESPPADDFAVDRQGHPTTLRELDYDDALLLGDEGDYDAVVDVVYEYVDEHGRVLTEAEAELVTAGGGEILDVLDELVEVPAENLGGDGLPGASEVSGNEQPLDTWDERAAIRAHETRESAERVLSGNVRTGMRLMPDDALSFGSAAELDSSTDSGMHASKPRRNFFDDDDTSSVSSWQAMSRASDASALHLGRVGEVGTLARRQPVHVGQFDIAFPAASPPNDGAGFRPPDSARGPGEEYSEEEERRPTPRHETKGASDRASRLRAPADDMAPSSQATERSDNNTTELEDGYRQQQLLGLGGSRDSTPRKHVSSSERPHSGLRSQQMPQTSRRETLEEAQQRLQLQAAGRKALYERLSAETAELHRRQKAAEERAAVLPGPAPSALRGKARVPRVASVVTRKHELHREEALRIREQRQILDKACRGDYRTDELMSMLNLSH
jgi:hypothetical protein